MASIPTFESLLLSIHQRLVQDSYPPKIAEKIADLGYSSEKSKEKIAEILDAIKRHLDIAPDAWPDVQSNLQEWSDFHRSAQINCWTGLASEQQVVWALCCYSYVPGLARRLAFWNLPEQLDKGMPGGVFWFLPRVVDGQVELPVKTVTNWLLDLLGMESIDANLAKALGNDAVKAGAKEDSVLKTLRAWRDGQNPRTVTIKEYFADSVSLSFDGAFKLELADVDSETGLDEALQFVGGRRLDAKALHTQIPMTEQVLDKVLSRSGAPEENRRFVELLRDRYQAPSLKTVRLWLLVARMTQDAYIDLLKLLCPGVSRFETDLRSNKVLQLVREFELVYNLTVDAWKKNDSVLDEERWFEAHLPPFLKDDLFISIRPAFRFAAPDRRLAHVLSRRFAAMSGNEPLDDLPLPGMPDLQILLKNHVERIRGELTEDQRIDDFVSEVKRVSPWRALQKESSIWVISQVAHDETISPKVRLLVIDRLRDLSSHPMHALAATCIELHHLLDTAEGRKVPAAQSRVQALLDEAADLQVSAGWNAPLLSFRAKHLLAQNMVGDALACFRRALDACSERNHGQLRGEIARDLLATDVVKNGFIPGNQEKYFRNMLAYGMFEMDLGRLEDTPGWAEDYFWENLYRPYRGVTALPRRRARS
jgi:hypothetical protein